VRALFFKNKVRFARAEQLCLIYKDKDNNTVVFCDTVTCSSVSISQVIGREGWMFCKSRDWLKIAFN